MPNLLCMLKINALVVKFTRKHKFTRKVPDRFTKDFAKENFPEEHVFRFFFSGRFEGPNG